MLCPNHLFISEHFAVFHDEGDVFEGGDVGERVAGGGDDVGKAAGFDGSDLVLHAEERGGGGGGGTDGLRGSLAVFHAQREFLGGVDVPVEAAGIGAEGDFDAGLNGAMESVGGDLGHGDPDGSAGLGATLGDV